MLDVLFDSYFDEVVLVLGLSLCWSTIQAIIYPPVSGNACVC